ARIAQVVSARALRTLRVRTVGEEAPFDTATYREDAETIAQAEAVLSRIDADAQARRLWSAHFEPLFGRLALLDAQMQQIPLAVPDEQAANPSMQDRVVRVEGLTREANALLAAAEPKVLADARARRWVRLSGEVRLWKVRRLDDVDPIPNWVAPFVPVPATRECPGAAGSPAAS